MSLNRAEQRRIMRDDAKRRNARTADDLERLVASHTPLPGTDPYHVSRGITGQPGNQNRQTSASPNTWDTVLTLKDGHVKAHGSRRVIGYTRKNDIGSVVPNTVKVTRDGKTTVVPVSSFRRERVMSARAQNVDLQNRRDEMRHTTAGELAPIGNVE